MKVLPHDFSAPRAGSISTHPRPTRIALGKPLLLLRQVTERPEAFLAGAARIVGAGREAIVEEASRLLSDEHAWRAMVGVENPYGDGWAARRIVETLVRWRRGERPLLPRERQFQGVLREEKTA